MRQAPFAGEFAVDSPPGPPQNEDSIRRATEKSSLDRAGRPALGSSANGGRPRRTQARNVASTDLFDRDIGLRPP